MRRQALSLDDTDPWCQTVMGFALSHHGQREIAGSVLRSCRRLNPGDVHIKYLRAWWLARTRADEALETLDLAVQRDPFPPTYCWQVRMIALFALRRYEDVIRAIARMVRCKPGTMPMSRHAMPT